MNRRIFCCFLVLLAPVLAPAQTPESDVEVTKKIKALQGEIDELRKRQEALIQELKERERARVEKLAAERAKRYAKIEMRGTLVKTPAGTKTDRRAEPTPKDTWHVAVNAMVVPISFGTPPEPGRFDPTQKLRDLAEKFAGKEVVVTGSLAIGFKRVPALHEGGFDFVEGAAAVTITSLRLVEE
ncbi:MAG: hypothetical protein U0793_07445 [Gemmataceae bacterium]